MDIDLIHQNLSTANLSKAKRSAEAQKQASIKDAQLKEACAGFEAILLHTMIKSMRKSLPGDAVFEESNDMNIYRSMYDQHLAEDLSKGRSAVGIKELLYNQLKDTL